MGWAGAARQPEVTAWSQTGLSNPGWAGWHSLGLSPRTGRILFSVIHRKTGQISTNTNYNDYNELRQQHFLNKSFKVPSSMTIKQRNIRQILNTHIQI